MKCNFCGHEVPRGAAECPYCHYQFTLDAEVLPSNERDSFEGVTIEEDGSTSGEAPREKEQAQEGYDPNHKFGQQPREEERVQQPFQIKTYGCGSFSLMALMILVVICVLSFLLMPMFLVFGAIGAVIVFLCRTFLPF